MGFVRFDGKGMMVGKDGKPVYIVGINYVANYVCTNFWEDWRPEVIRADLQKIHDMGLNAVRIPMIWGWMEPEEGHFRQEFLERFEVFLGWCSELDLYVMPWFLVGVATKFYDIPWRNGRPFFGEEMTRAAENHLKSFISLYCDEEQFLCWDICDEPEYYSCAPGTDQLPYRREVIRGWVERLAAAIKSVDTNHIVTLGFGQVATQHFGIHVRDMAPLLDCMVVTCYPGPAYEGIDTYRNNYFVPYNVKFNTLGKPVFTCEAPGNTSTVFSDEVIGRYFNVSLYSNLINGSAGVLPWVFNDFREDIWHLEPLDESNFEPWFGIVRTDGTIKPSGQALQKFAEFMRDVRITEYEFSKAQAAVMVPRLYYEEIKETLPKVYAAYTMLKGIVDDVDLVWDGQDYTGYKLLLVPSSRGMTTTGWGRLKSYAENGGTVCFVHDDRREGNAYFDALFGVRQVTQKREFDYDSLTALEDCGPVGKGMALQLPKGFHSEVVRVVPKEAKALFAYRDGVPAVTRHLLGRGKAFLVTKPVFHGHMECRYSDFLSSGVFDLLRFLVAEADVEPMARTGDARIETGWMPARSGNGGLVVMINHDNNPVTADLVLRGAVDVFKAPGGVRLEMRLVEGNTVLPGVQLEAGGAVAFRVEGRP